MIKSCFWAWARPVRLAVAGSEAKGAGPCAGLLRASLAPRRAEHDAAMGVGGQNQSLGAAAGLLRWECSTGARHGLALALRTRRGPPPAGRRRCALMSERASGSTRAFSPAEARPAARASDGCLRLVRKAAEGGTCPRCTRGCSRRCGVPKGARDPWELSARVQRVKQREGSLGCVIAGQGIMQGAAASRSQGRVAGGRMLTGEMG